MCNGIIAKKVGMSRVFQEDTGDAVPVTYLEVEPNTIVRMKTQEKDGYNAVVLGVKPKKWKSRKGKEHVRYSDQKEFAVESLDGLEAGKELSCDKFAVHSKVTVTGSSKGRGFQGVVKRYGFAGGPSSHGSTFHRRPGSVGMKEWPGRVIKGKKLPGRMGNQQVTLHGREILACDPAKGVVAVKGPVPGPNGSRVYLTLES